ncbi:MAG: hypothetical protein NZ455_02480 [Bacteroidia bacterium]|nr:hypothetical protein [Bacteroidia bacterium]
MYNLYSWKHTGVVHAYKSGIDIFHFFGRVLVGVSLRSCPQGRRATG